MDYEIPSCAAVMPGGKEPLLNAQYGVSFLDDWRKIWESYTVLYSDLVALVLKIVFTFESNTCCPFNLLKFFLPQPFSTQTLCHLANSNYIIMLLHDPLHQPTGMADADVPSFYNRI